MLVQRDQKLTGVFFYTPSLAAAILFCILFALTTLLHVYQVVRTRTWFFIVFCIGGIAEFIGYIGRIMSANQAPNYTLAPYVMDEVLVLIAPTLFAASIYMELGRIVEMVEGEKYLLIRRKFITGTFVTGDVISFLMQGGGGGLMASDNLSTRSTGEHIIVGGLFVQIVSFGIFVLTSLLFHRRLKSQPTDRSLSTPWRRHISAIYAVSMLIFVRSIIRVVEFLQGFSGYVYGHEVFIYVFDALPMFVAMVIMNWIHPSEIMMYIKGGMAAIGFKLRKIETPAPEIVAV